MIKVAFKDFKPLLSKKACLFAKMVAVAQKEINNGNQDNFYLAKIETAQFYFKKLFPETLSLIYTATSGSNSLMNTENALV